MERRRRRIVAIIISLVALSSAVYGGVQELRDQPPTPEAVNQTLSATTSSAVVALADLPVKGRAPKTGYSRAQFGNGWQDVGRCDIRNYILARDMEHETLVSDTDCRVASGSLNDPYTGKVIPFTKGADTSDDVQIDHIVALSDAWQKGAQQLSFESRQAFANDPLNLLAVDGPTNNKKGDSDAASWLPPHKPYRCQYVARQIAVKKKYALWVTQAEHDAMSNVLKTCPDQSLPIVTNP